MTSNLLDVSLSALAVWLIYKIVLNSLTRLKGTKLRGPKSWNLITGVAPRTVTDLSGELYGEWVKEYGRVFQTPSFLGAKRTVLFDPLARAIAHFYSLESTKYLHPKANKLALSFLLGKGLLWSEGEDHVRQRRVLGPGFTNAAIGRYVSVFYDSAYKAKNKWDTYFQTSNTVTIEIQDWMNRISLDTIGLAAFSHDFGTLGGEQSEVKDVFTSASSSAGPVGEVMLILNFVICAWLPFVPRLPTRRMKFFEKMNQTVSDIAMTLLKQNREEDDGKPSGKTSIMGALLRAENATTQRSLSEEEIISEMVLLILAGFETTSTSLSWALIELARHPEKQDRLRQELNEASGSDPTYEELTQGLPYLNGVFHEILRLHAPVLEVSRVASENDIMPLSKPIVDANGKTVDHIVIPKGTQVTIPLVAINRSTEIWGQDAHGFKPERWGKEGGVAERAKELGGYHHLMTFSDGPRICLGRAFAAAEFKCVLAVLVRYYRFELENGPGTNVVSVKGIVTRPSTVGNGVPEVNLRVTRLD